MTKAPDVGFLFWSPESIRTLCIKEQRDEIERARGFARDKLADRVGRRQMSEMEAKADLAIFDQILIEWRFWIDREAATSAFELPPIPARRFRWAEKINLLRGEIMRRRHKYPRMINQRRLTIEDAERHLALMECAHARYWFHGLDFMDGADPRAIADNIRTEIARRNAWAHAHRIDTDHRLDPTIDHGAFSGDWSNHPRIEVAAA